MGAVTLTLSGLRGDVDVSSGLADGDTIQYNLASGYWKNAPLPAAPVTSVFGRTGAVSLLNTDILTALGYTPASTTQDVTLAPATSARNTIQPTGPTIVPLTLKGASLQSGAYLKIVTSAGVKIAELDSAGSVFVADQQYVGATDGTTNYGHLQFVVNQYTRSLFGLHIRSGNPLRLFDSTNVASTDLAANANGTVVMANASAASLGLQNTTWNTNTDTLVVLNPGSTTVGTKVGGFGNLDIQLTGGSSRNNTATVALNVNVVPWNSGASTYTANLFQLQISGVTKLSVTAAGTVVVAGTHNVYVTSSNSGVGAIGTLTGGPIALMTSGTNQLIVDSSGYIANIPSGVAASVHFRTKAANAIAMIVQGTTTQTANLLEWCDVSSNPLTVVDASGNIGVGVSVPLFPLHVVGSTGRLFTVKNTNAGTYTICQVQNNQASESHCLSYGRTGSAYAGAIVTGGPTGEIGWMMTTDATPLVFGANNLVSMVLGSDNLVGIGINVPTARLHVVQAVHTSGSPSALIVTSGAHTTLAASTEAISINLNASATVQFATGALTTQRAMVVQAPTYGFVGASTLTTAVTVDITGAPVAGTNATLTNTYGLRVNTGVAAGVALVLQGAASQSGDYVRVHTSAGTSAPLFRVDSSGYHLHTPLTTGADADILWSITGKYGRPVTFNNTGELKLGTSAFLTAAGANSTVGNWFWSTADLVRSSSGSGGLGFTTGTTTQVILTVKSAASQSGDRIRFTDSSNITDLHIDAAGNLALDKLGNSFRVKEGSNACMGTATLVGGTATVSTTAVTANSRIFLMVQSLGTVTVPVAIGVSARTAGTSFTISSANPADTSVIAWLIMEPS